MIESSLIIFQKQVHLWILLPQPTTFLIPPLRHAHLPHWMAVDTGKPLQAYSCWGITGCSFSNTEEGALSVGTTFLSSIW